VRTDKGFRVQPVTVIEEDRDAARVTGPLQAGDSIAIRGIVALKGAWQGLGLPIDAFPDVSTTQVKIIMKAPGMTPEEVEARIVVPIELELLGIPHSACCARSKYAIADITLDFEDGTDIYWARQQVSERLSGATWATCPGLTGGLAPITTPLGEMFMFTSRRQLSLAERRSLLDWVIRPALRTAAGRGRRERAGRRGAQLRGGARCGRAGSAPACRCAAAATRSSANNRNDGAGRLRVAKRPCWCAAEGSIRSLDDVRAIVVQRDGKRARG
jgi:cobalt-zinc-cadmium resistance protein CzcA